MRLHGPGKYDDLAELVCKATSCSGVVLIVMGGYKGDGVSVKGTAEAMQTMPTLLRKIADALQEDIDAGGQP